MLKCSGSPTQLFCYALAFCSIAFSACGGSNSIPPHPLFGPGATLSRSADRVAPQGVAALQLPDGADGSAYTSAVLGDGPLAYYKLSDSSTVLHDSSATGLGGTYGSDVTRGKPSITNGTSNAAEFPGGSVYKANGFAYTRVARQLEPATITLEAWVKIKARNTNSHDVPIVGYGDLSRGIRYGLFVHGLTGGNTFAYVQHNAGQKDQLYVYGKTRLQDGYIYHIVAAFDGSRVTTYVNGVVDQQVNAPGTIAYSADVVHNGLQIGGTFGTSGYSDASFDGTIGQVAIYSGALPATRVQAHFLAGQIVPLETDKPAEADTFVDSIGINAHFEDSRSEYAKQYEGVKNLLVASGIRHIRVGMTFNNADFLREMRELAGYGVRGSYITQQGYSQSQITKFPSLVGASFEQYEPPNEQDDVGNPNWLGPCKTFQKNLYTWVKNDPATARFAVLAPPLANRQSYSELGDISAYADYGNFHDYFGAFNPGTPGWGGLYPPYGYYGSIGYNVNLARVVAGRKPLMSTETGYGTIAGNPITLDYRTDLRYMTRLFFEQFNGGVSRSYTYELLDQGGNAVFANFGIVQTNLHAKPAYTAIKSLIAEIKDPGPHFTTTARSFKLSGFNQNVHHTLLQKRDGTYILALWIEQPSWNTLDNRGGDINVAPQMVTVTAVDNVTDATSLVTMDELGLASRQSIGWHDRSATFEISDKVSLLEIGRSAK